MKVKPNIAERIKERCPYSMNAALNRLKVNTELQEGRIACHHANFSERAITREAILPDKYELYKIVIM
jgi:hypothetical protein